MTPHTRLIATSLFILAALCVLGSVVTVRSQTATSQLRRITNTSDGSINLNPSMSGDGQHLILESTNDIAGVGGPPRFRAIRANIAGTPPTFAQIGTMRAPAAAISQDGSRISFASTDNPLGTNPDNNSEIFIYDGMTLSQLTNTSPSDITERVRQGNFQPSISDDGRLLAFASNRDLVGANRDANLEIFIYDTATQSFTQITDSSGTIGATDAKISGNGLHLAFVKDAGAPDAESSLQRDLIFYDRPTGQTRVVASDVSGLALTPGRAISDDGTRVVYAADTATNTSGNGRQVFLFDDRVNLARQITALGTRVEDVPLHPTIGGDGSRIAFATRRNVIGGNSDASVELYTYDIPAGQFARVTDAPSAATSEVVSSLSDDGLIVAFHFPRVLSEAASSTQFANTSEIYIATLPARPQFSSDLKILNGASLGKEPSTTEAISPNTIAVARATNLALNTTQAQRLADNSFPQSLDGTTVSVNGRAAQIFFVSPTQVNFHVPDETELGAAEVVVRNPDGFETRGTVTVLRAAPGLFTASGDGTGEAIALDAATLQSGPFDPTGEPNNERRIIIFATGVRSASNVTVTLAGRAVTVEATVASPDLPGLDQIHVVLPSTLSGAGTIPLVVRADNRSGNTTNIMITGPVRRPTSISVSPTAPVVSIGSSLLLKTTVLDQNNVELTDAPLQFGSSDSSIAVVDRSGLVHGVSPGNATITVFAGDISATVELRVFQPTLAINEVLVDPPNETAGDANRDGTRSSSQDEFVEIVNATERDIDIGGYQILTRASNGADTLRHTFAADTIVSAGTAVVVFGGAQTVGFNPNDPLFGGALVLTASSDGLSLLNGGSVVTLRDGAGATVDRFAYGDEGNISGASNQSITRAPDITGSFTLHGSAAGNTGRIFSPGTRIDGTPFSPTQPITRIEVAPASAIIAAGAPQQLTARAFNAAGQEIVGVIFRWQSSVPTVATIDRNGLVTSGSAGVTQITVSARGVQSAPAQLTVVPPEPTVTRVEVAPASTTINRGVTQQFTALAFNRNNEVVTNAIFAWTSSNAAVAVVDSSGQARGVGLGEATITATTSDGAGGTVQSPATIIVQVPLVINEILADVPLDAAATADIEGDANRDGVRSSDDDEFVELLNNSDAPLDISGVEISDSTSVRYTIPANTTLAAGRAVVVFGGGTPPAIDPVFGGALILRASSLGLNDTGDTLTVKLRVAGVDVSLATQTYDASGTTARAPSDQSLTRAPDAEVGTTGGLFIAHTSAVDAAGRVFSPGTRAQGTPFGSPPLTRIEVTPLSATINTGQTQTFTARAYSNQSGTETEVSNVAFIWDSSDAARAAVSPIIGQFTTASGIAAGTTQVRARAGSQQSSVTLTINAVVATAQLTPEAVILTAGNSATFTATARDASGGVISDALFVFSLSNQSSANTASIIAATPNTVTVRSAEAGSVTVVASYTRPSDNARIEDASLMTIKAASSTPIPTTGQVIINEALLSFADSTTQPRHDFIELFNTTNQTFDISGLSISFRSTDSASPRTVVLPGAVGSGTTLIMPSGYFLIVNGADTFSVTADYNAEVEGFDLTSTAGGVKIEIGGVRLDGLVYKDRIDTALPAPFDTFGEGDVFVLDSSSTNRDLVRSPNGTDTNNNLNDFRRNGTAVNVRPKAANLTIP